MNRFNFTRPTIKNPGITTRDASAFGVGAGVMAFFGTLFGYLFGGRKTAKEMGKTVNDLAQENEALALDLDEYDEYWKILEKEFPDVFQQLKVKKNEAKRKSDILERTKMAMQAMAAATGDTAGIINPEEQEAALEFAAAIIDSMVLDPNQEEPESKPADHIPANPVAPVTATTRRGHNKVAATVTAAVAPGAAKADTKKQESEPVSI